MLTPNPAYRIWLLTSAVLATGIGTFWLMTGSGALFAFICSFLLSITCSLPILPLLAYGCKVVERQPLDKPWKIIRLILIVLLCSLIYGLIAGAAGDLLDEPFFDWARVTIGVTAVLFACSLIAILISTRTILKYFSDTSILKTTNMDNVHQTLQHQFQNTSTKILIKGIITGGLILALMIPTLFIMGLVEERKERQQQVVKEVSSKWGSQQTLSGPYIFLPYTTTEQTADGKTLRIQRHYWLLPENIKLTGNVTPEVRPRSIYKVLLYRSQLNTTGNFVLRLPRGVDASQVQWNDSRICYGLNDYKGIEERLFITANQQNYELSPGLPETDIDSNGLSAPVSLSAADIGRSMNFSMNLKLRGSEKLYFVPLGGNSTFNLSSTWQNPSFDGSSLPTERRVSDAGFSATWQFNKANLPFGTILNAGSMKKESFAFGLNMLQPADNYAKAERSVKYAILFIGLTFSLFFVIELLQKKPLHPVQYVLVGLALVIFYSLLLSLSEFIPFDMAYIVAALATVLLITWYAYSHFKTWKAAGAFFGVLTTLYAFTFVLVRLEDTALLIGSIGLFIILALVMIASRKINWYNPATALNASTVQ